MPAFTRRFFLFLLPLAAISSLFAQPTPADGVTVRDLGPGIVSFPLLGTAIKDDTIFVGSRNLSPTRVAAFDVSKKRVTSSFTLGNGVYVQSLAFAGDRYLYAGVSAARGGHNLYRCDLETGEATGVAVIPGQSVATLAIAPDGIIYTTGRPEGRTRGPALFSFNPETCEVSNLGTPKPDAGQALGLAVTDTTVYFGCGASSAGGRPAGLFAIDREIGEITDILPPEMSRDYGINKIEVFDGFLAVGGSRVGVMDLDSGDWQMSRAGSRQHQFLHIDDQLLVASSGGIHAIDLPSFTIEHLKDPGENLGDYMGLGQSENRIFGAMSSGHVWTCDRRNGETATYDLVKAEAPGGPEMAQSLGVIGQKIYIGGNNAVAVHDLRDRSTTRLSIPGEVKDMTAVGDTMYMATYAPAALWEHRPNEDAPPRRVAQLPPSQNRPHVVRWDESHNLVAIGNRSDAGGGALSLYDPETRELTPHINLLGEEQWIWNAAPADDGLIYIAGAVSRGAFGDIAAFDPASGEIVWRMENPLGEDGGVSSMVAIGQRLYGVTIRDPRFFVIDISSPRNPEIIHEQPLGELAGNSGSLVRLLVDGGRLYGASSDTLFHMDLETLQGEILVGNLGAEWFSGSRLAAGSDRSIYTLAGRNIIEVRLPLRP